MSYLKQSENSHGASKSNTKQKAGFAVLFSVMLASFLITLGISIFSISLKEIQITTSVRDSQIAYYAADSARECALYNDVKLGLFPSCIDSADPCTPTTLDINPIITCNGTTTQLYFYKLGSSVYYTGSTPVNDFFRYDAQINTPRADIKITKTYNSGNIVTAIETYGHNTGVLGRRVERGISQTHN